MHGPGLPPQQGPQPSTGGIVALRVLFALLPVLSCGFLGWGTMLRLAVVTRKPRDWWLLAVNCALTVAWIALIGADPTPDTDGWQGNTGAFGIIITGFLTCVYFLVADIRHYGARAAAPTAPGTRRSPRHTFRRSSRPGRRTDTRRPAAHADPHPDSGTGPRTGHPAADRTGARRARRAERTAAQADPAPAPEPAGEPEHARQRG